MYKKIMVITGCYQCPHFRNTDNHGNPDVCFFPYPDIWGNHIENKITEIPEWCPLPESKPVDAIGKEVK